MAPVVSARTGSSGGAAARSSICATTMMPSSFLLLIVCSLLLLLSAAPSGAAAYAPATSSLHVSPSFAIGSGSSTAAATTTERRRRRRRGGGDGRHVLVLPTTRAAGTVVSRSTALAAMSSGDDDSAEVEAAAAKEARSNAFWAQQQAVATTFRGDEAKSAKEESQAVFAKRRLGLVNETFFFSTLLFALLWLLSTTPFTPISYLLGASLGTAYSYGLGKYVETIGGTADDVGDIQGAGVGQARFAFLIVLVLFVGKFRDQGLQEIPSILGFFTYQLASLSQGLKEVFDDDE